VDSAQAEVLEEVDWRKRNGLLLNIMLETYIRGSETGDDVPRAARLTEALVDMALHAEDQRLRFDATKFIFERVDGKAVERKEIKSMKIEGIIYLPTPEKADELDS
jgi:hypothetical protein